jgi:hexosaminidase
MLSFRNAVRLTVPALLAATLFSLSASAQSLKLIPIPREVRAQADQRLTNGVRVVCAACSSEDQFAADDLAATLRERGITISAAGFPIEFTRLATHPVANFTDEMKPEGYVITPGASSLNITAVTAEGIFYGAQTVKQLIEGRGLQATLHVAAIRDWPALRYRGLSDDLSRGPIPTLDYQKKQIRVLAAYKVNIYSPYFEHTMQYTNLPLMAPPGGSLTQAQARELVAYAAKYHITVIPEQEAFGHLHYLLNWEQYASLAETPHGQVFAPAQPEALKLIHGMFSELATIYPSPFLHIGADETVELGKGQTKSAVDAQGLGAVYLNYMQQIVTDLKPLNRKLLFWGDIAMHDPDLVKKLPADFKQATIAVAWEYNPHPEGFARYITPFTNAGMETWVAPGINNWSRVYPDWNNALANIQQFTFQGQKAGITGQLNTIWNDDGETLADNNWYGILFGAEAAWHKGEASIPAFQSSYGAVFHGDASGRIDQAQQELMAAHKLLHDSPLKAGATDLFFWVDPWSPDGLRQASQVRPILAELRLHAERAITLIAQARSANPGLREQDALDALDLGARRMDLIGLKFQVSDEIAASYAHAYSLQASHNKDDRADVSRELNNINAPNGKLQDLRNGYSLMRDLYQTAWLKSNRPYFLTNNLERFDLTIQLWLQRIDKVRTAQRQWSNTQNIPAAADLGIPQPVR